MNYWGFIRSFMSSADRYTADFANRLSYLSQYCDGEALDAINGCTVLEPELGHNGAISILQRRFGQPYVIARCYTGSLTEGCSLMQDDAKGLTDLAEKIKMCATTFRQLRYESDMNSCRTLGKPLLSPPPQSSTSPVKPHCCALEQGCNKRLDVQSYVNSPPDRAPRTQPTDPVLRIRSEHHRESGLISELGSLISICTGLPKKELKKFSGNTMNYWGFIRSFMSSADRYTADFANRLSYLSQYCDGEALDAINGCTVLEPELGHNGAISILQRRFGQPYVIARCYTGSLTEGCSLMQDDAKGLTDLAEKIKMCATTFRQLRYESDMNSCRTLG
ncbi:hypothetical protein EG68_01105 [Paragonimus skrjabini miyazakii]|uniref:Uncharacterized protein n=1 Tax=Paragonimus skrjabini miyazakii TaxID=59628 RepID=A0A8S9Z799_9TREM|nr:hypothetical protein EG68_01105 [Paragonimus skrjabini miyazakii]